MKRRLLLVLSAVTSISVATATSAQNPALLDATKLKLASANVLVLDANANTPIYVKAADEVTPIASLTKLMTAMVTLDAKLPMDESIAVDMDDFDYLKGSSSRLRMGSALPRREMLRLALMASENRAASSLGRHYPGGLPAFVAAMNAKAKALGMTHTEFSDSTGLSAKNVSTASDLALMVGAAAKYPLIREFTTTQSHSVEIASTGQTVGFRNTNALVKDAGWDIQVSKTGFIREAGKCLVMMATISSRPVVIVLLDSLGRYTRISDAIRVKQWLETGDGELVKTAKAARFVPAAKAAAPKARTRVQGQFPPRLAQAGKARGV
jgi:D-alanyl-D-alanine endopeptidase (penicillin-binding protein 7)